MAQISGPANKPEKHIIMKTIEVSAQKMTEFIKSVKLHFDNIDKIMKLPDSYERGKMIAKEMNRINFDYDAFLHFTIHIPLEKLQSVRNKSFKL
jgi:alpha-N-acetylglucosamine transferase